MNTRVLLAAAAMAVGLAGAGHAEVVATDNGITVREPSVPAPVRGMTMDQVIGKFGNPVSKTPAVGKPPISRWEYPGFVVYFEYDHVIHAVATSAAPVAG